MTRFTFLKLAVFIFVLVLRPNTEGQVIPVVPLTPFIPRPLCNYQMALANQACLYLPFTQVPPQPPRAPYGPPSPPSDDDRHEHRHGHGRRHGHDNDNDDENEHDHDHDNDHDDDHDHDRNRNRGHGHKHRHRKHRRHSNTPMEDECCKWLSQVDDQCVCDLLARLPPFLVRPVHKYAVIVGRSCNITYACGSRFRV